MEPPKPDSPESEPEPEYQPVPIKIKPMPRPMSPPPLVDEEKISSRRIVMSEEEISQNSLSGFADVVSQPEEAKLMGFTSLRLGEI